MRFTTPHQHDSLDPRRRGRGRNRSWRDRASATADTAQPSALATVLAHVGLTLRTLGDAFRRRR